MKPASRFKRFVACIVDYLILATTAFCLVSLLYLILFLMNPSYLGFETIDGTAKFALVFLIFCFLLTGPFFACFESSKYQATPGKKLMNLYVSNRRNQKINFKRAFLRYFLWCSPPYFFIFTVNTISSDYRTSFVFALCIISFLWYVTIFFTKERKTIYDMLSSTRVNTKLNSSKQLKKDLEEEHAKLIRSLQERLEIQ